MPLLLFKPLRGHQGPLEDAIQSARPSGFDGLQAAPPSAPEQRLLLHEHLQEAGLAFVGDISTGETSAPAPSIPPNQHLLELRSAIECCLDLSPLVINVRTGSDAWPLALQIDFFEKVLRMETEYGVDIALETSRGRSFFHPWIAREIVKQLPDLKIACNFAQWCCVAGRLVLDDDPRLLRELAQNCWHLHASVGFSEGPQVPDPRLPEHAATLESHLKWWETVWHAQTQRGLEAITMQPAFQPDPRFPQKDATEINRWMARTLRERFTSWEHALPTR